MKKRKVMKKKAKTSAAFDAIKMAMVAEIKAQTLYAQAASKTTNPEAREMFKQLADFEQGHYNRLKELLTSLSKKKLYITYEGRDFDYKIKSEVTGPIEENKEDMLDVLIMAIGAERNAEKHYTQLALKTKDAAGKQMFERLAFEENTHYRLLSDEFYLLNNKGRWGD